MQADTSISSSKTLLVVGANGFIGTHICAAAQKKGYLVSGLVRTKSEAASGIRLYTKDELLNSTITFDCIIYAAGSFRDTPESLYDSNVALVRDIAKRYPDAQSIYISSVAVYGVHSDIITLNSAYNNPSTYGKAKLAGEYAASLSGNNTILRLSNVYGVGMDPSLFIPTAASQAKSKGSITVYGDGKRTTDYVHAEDAASLAVHLLLSQPMPSVVLGVSGESVSNLEIARKIQRISPRTRIEFIGSDSSPSYRFDGSQLHTIANFSFKYSIDDGLRKAYESF